MLIKAINFHCLNFDTFFHLCVRYTFIQIHRTPVFRIVIKLSPITNTQQQYHRRQPTQKKLHNKMMKFAKFFSLFIFNFRLIGKDSAAEFFSRSNKKKCSVSVIWSGMYTCGRVIFHVYSIWFCWLALFLLLDACERRVCVRVCADDVDALSCRKHL